MRSTGGTWSFRAKDVKRFSEANELSNDTAPSSSWRLFWSASPRIDLPEPVEQHAIPDGTALTFMVEPGSEPEVSLDRVSDYLGWRLPRLKRILESARCAGRAWRTVA